MNVLLARYGLRVGIAVGLIAAVLLWLRFHDRAVVQDYRKQLDDRAAASATVASEERVKDAASLSAQELRYEQAISVATDEAPSGAAISLNCERLRRANVQLPAICRPNGGD